MNEEIKIERLALRVRNRESVFEIRRRNLSCASSW